MTRLGEAIRETFRRIKMGIQARNTPVRIDRSNFASEEISTKRTSAGNLFPARIYKISPGTISMAAVVTWAPSRSS